MAADDVLLFGQSLFPVEAESDTVENWGAIPEYHRALERVAGAGALEVLAAETRETLQSLRSIAHLLYRNFRDQTWKLRGI